MAVEMPLLHRQQLSRGVLPTYASTHSSRLCQESGEEMEMARKGILPPTLKTNIKTYCPLLVRQSPVPPHPETPSYLSSFPCTESESSGDDQTESGSLEAPADGSEEELSENPLVGKPNDVTGKHREWGADSARASTVFRKKGKCGAQACIFVAKITTGWYKDGQIRIAPSCDAVNFCERLFTG